MTQEQDEKLMNQWLQTEEAKKVAKILKVQVNMLIPIWKSEFLNDLFVKDILNLSDASQTELWKLMIKNGLVRD